jgi:A/G-specific adenine glycosylase
LQRTRAETIAAFFPEFIREFPSWKVLNTANIEQLQHSLQPIGLWRRRAASIYALAQEMAKRNGRFPQRREEIEALPGIGQYITNAILLFCHKVPQPLLDANMARVLERVFGPRKLSDIRYDPYLQNLAMQIVHSKHPKEINWAILDLAATICLIKNPLCHACPLVAMCSWNKKKSETIDWFLDRRILSGHLWGDDVDHPQ